MASPASWPRPQWDACRAYLRDRDVLVVTKLDRIGRSVGNLVSVAADLHERGVELVVLDQAIDTATPAGRMLFHVLAAIAEFKHDLIADGPATGWPRPVPGTAAAAARGPSISPDKLGRPPALPARDMTAGGSPLPSDLPGQLVPGTAARRSRGLTPRRVAARHAAADGLRITKPDHQAGGLTPAAILAISSADRLAADDWRSRREKDC